MKLSFTLKSHHAIVVVDTSARKLHQQGRYRLTVRGLPSFWDVPLATRLITKQLNAQGFTCVTVTASSASLTKWNASVSFYLPSEVVKSKS